MRENRTCGSEGGEAQSLPYPYPGGAIGIPLPSRADLERRSFQGR